MIALH